MPLRQLIGLMSIQGLLLKVQILMTDETVPPERFGEMLHQTTFSESLNGHTAIAGTLLLENGHTSNGDGDADHSHNQPARGLLLVAPRDWQSHGTVSAPADLPEPVPVIHSHEAGADQDRTVNEEAKSAPMKPLYLPVKSERKVILLKIDDIDWVQAGHNSVTLQVGKQAHRLRGTLESFQQKLPPDRFVRINRSNIVQIDRIKELDRRFSGDCRIELHDGTHLNLSRRYRARFHAMGLL
jgi:LytTr DNA-binding domain